jgi:UrcA family protein
MTSMHTHTTPRSIAKTAFAAVAALCAGFFVSSTFAAVSGEALQQKVSYADLNLTRAEGVAALYKRVHSAAENVCAPLESRELTQQSQWRACVRSSISRAIAQIDVPALTVYADARNGHSGSRLTAANVP